MKATAALLLALLLVAPAAAKGDQDLRLCPGTAFETPVYVRAAAAPGPTVLVVSGMHGSEAAGPRAAEAIRHWPIAKGRVVVLPRANAPGFAKAVREVPGEHPFDLNRVFPPADDAPPIAREIWSLVETFEPDWVIDLHESVDYRSRTTKERPTLGNTLICAGDETTFRTGGRMAAAANGLTPQTDRRWHILASPVEGSLARAAADATAARAIIAETCRKDHLAIRVRQHRIVIHTLLDSLGMLPEGSSPYRVFPDARTPGETRVAIFDSFGIGSSSAGQVERCLAGVEGMAPRRITANEIMDGALAQYDVVVFPGGTGGGTAKTLTGRGRDAVREFVRDGGGYFGVCAGAYLATAHYDWSLGILDARVVDSRHWARGNGTVRISLTATGRRALGEKRSAVDIRYGQGPLLAPAARPDLPDFETLATYETEIAKNGAPTGVMKGTPALVRGRFGKGRVVAASPHAESSADESLRAWIPRLVRWLADRD